MTAPHENTHISTNGNTNGINATQGSDKQPLNIIIVGAGIGGLSAAIALRHAGHNITILERSSFSQELGAAVQLAPNSNGLLRRYGIYAESFGAVENVGFNEYNANGEHVRSMPSARHLFQHPWLLAHRVRLHNHLKQVATSEDGEGRPAKLLLATKVEKLDAANAVVTTKNGETFKADLIVGADGVHSVARKYITGGEGVKPFDSGKSAFRFMIAAELVGEDTRTRKYVEKPGELFVWFANDRRVVMYPTNNNEELNFVCIHPSKDTNATGDWNNETSVESMLKVFENFDESVKALLSKADPSTLKVWNLLDMPKLPTFVEGRLALIGDAAHPFTPHQGQGAGMAIEDGVSLAVMLPLGTQPEKIPERLALYNKARYDRSHQIQHFSRIVGQDDNERSERVDMTKFMFINFVYDEWDHSSQVFREYQWAGKPQMYWRQPIAFGPMPGPRQNFGGDARSAEHSTFVTASIKFKTSKTVLENLFPPGDRKGGWSFISPGSVAMASFSQTTLNKMDWLGGGGYNHIGLYIHGVQYTKKDGTVVKGAYLPILFENLTDPIVSGREELGMPKLFTSIDVYRRETSYFITTAWQGAVWGQFQLTNLKEEEVGNATGNVSGDADEGILVYRYMPSVGRTKKGEAAEEYTAYVPFKEERPVPRTNRVWSTKKASFKVDGKDWDALPTLHHIIERLAEIPVLEVISGRVVEGTGVPDVACAQRVE